MLKIKHARTADCVVAGFRWHKNGPGTHIGSLLLGLYDDEGKLHHVGITSSFPGTSAAHWPRSSSRCARTRWTDHPWARMGRVGRIRAGGRVGTRMPGATSRWNRARICPGSRSASSASLRSLTTTCRAIASATQRLFSAGGPTNSPGLSIRPARDNHAVRAERDIRY